MASSPVTKLGHWHASFLFFVTQANIPVSTSVTVTAAAHQVPLDMKLYPGALLYNIPLLV
eukprot:3249792-Rhodomonas_salina.1